MFNPAFPWASFLLDWFRVILDVFTLPLHRLVELNTFYVVYGIEAVLLLATVALVFVVARQLRGGSLSRPWMARVLRALLGVVAVLSPMLMGTFFAFVACDYTSGDGFDSASLAWNEPCASSPAQAILYGFSCLLMVCLVIVTCYSGLMHKNEMQSASYIARAHSRLDLYGYLVNLAMTLLFTLLGHVEGLRVLLAVIFLLAHGVTFAGQLVFQPSYQSLMNDFKTCLNSITMLSGVMYLVISTQDAGSDVADILTVAYLCLVPIVAVAGVFGSVKIRNWLISSALKVYGIDWDKLRSAKIAPLHPFHDLDDDSNRESRDQQLKELVRHRDFEQIPDDELLAYLRENYEAEANVSFITSLKAALVTCQIRFVFQFKQNKELLAVAEHILKRGLIKYPQSTFLRLQYISFVLAFKHTRHVAQMFLDECTSHDTAWDLKYVA